MQAVDFIAIPVRMVLFPFEEVKKVLVYHHTYNEYLKFKKRAGLLEIERIAAEEFMKENKRLKGLLDLKQTLPFQSVAAEVVGRDSSQWSSVIIIDKGEKDGIKAGMPVVDTSSILGKIWEVGKNTSKVLLINDPTFSVAAILERSRESGLITGTLQGTCRMRYLAPQADIRIGDRVLTSEISSFFPAGFLIGEVQEIQESLEGPSMECLVIPTASLSQIEEVLIIKNIK